MGEILLRQKTGEPIECQLTKTPTNSIGEGHSLVQKVLFFGPLYALEASTILIDHITSYKTHDWFLDNVLSTRIPKNTDGPSPNNMAKIVSCGVSISGYMLAYSFFSLPSVSRGDAKLNGVFDNAAAYITRVEPYKTDLAKAKEFCDSIIKEKISRCERLTSADDLIKILKNIDTGKIAESMNGYNEKTYQEKAGELINRAISEAINKAITIENEKLESQKIQLRKDFEKAKETLRNPEPVKPTSDAATKTPGFTISKWQSYQPVTNKAAGKAA